MHFWLYLFYLNMLQYASRYSLWITNYITKLIIPLASLKWFRMKQSFLQRWNWRFWWIRTFFDCSFQMKLANNNISFLKSSLKYLKPQAKRFEDCKHISESSNHLDNANINDILEQSRWIVVSAKGTSNLR